MRTAAICAALLSLCVLGGGDVVTERYDARAREAAAIIRRNIPACFVYVEQDVPLHSIDPVGMRLLVLRRGVIGLYMDMPNIWIDGTLCRVDFTHTALHEYGHFVYFRLMTLDERRLWGRVWELLRDADMLPSDYAATNAQEGFAECFAEVYFLRGKRSGGAIERGFMAALEHRLAPLARRRTKPREIASSPWLPLVEFRAFPA